MYPIVANQGARRWPGRAANMKGGLGSNRADAQRGQLLLLFAKRIGGKPTWVGHRRSRVFV